MQIKYRITIVFTSIVSVILLVLCASIYFASYKNRTEQFHGRLYRKGISTADLFLLHNMSAHLVQEINRTSPSALQNKSLSIYDSKLNLLFNYTEDPEDSVHLDYEQLRINPGNTVHYIDNNERDIAIMNYTLNNTSYVIAVSAFDADTADWLPKLRFILIVSFIASITIVLITGYVFSLRLVRAFSNLSNQINHISTQHFSSRLDFGKGKDELQKLTITINNLLDRLQASFDTQRRFIDNASHELSTPMASISSQIEVALQRERSMREYQNVLTSVNDDIRRLSTLVKSLLEISKISGSANGPDLFPVRVDELIMRLPSDLKKINPKNEVKIVIGEMGDDEHELLVYGNEELIYAALKNIVHNACKYSGDYTALVSLHVDKDMMLISVADNGPGISEEDQHQIIQPFFRNTEMSQKVSGFGLGLPLAFQIIKLYNGNLTLNSVIGEGSVFTIELPIAKA
jgi:signal transduction histidine kinase